MKALQLFLLTCTTVLLFKVGNLPAQSCEFWSDPIPVSDSNSDNRNATLVNISIGYGAYMIFWERTLELLGSEIVYIDYYNMNMPETAVYAEGFIVSNPQVISMSDWYPDTDTLAFVFYQSNQSGNEDIYFTVMTDTGFMAPVPLANSTLDETHLRVSPGGGMVWQEGDIIRFTRLYQDNSGFYFEPVVSIDEDDCFNPDIQNADLYTGEQYIAWQKGSPESPETWYSYWSYDNDEWSEPTVLFEDGYHSGIRFSKGIDFTSWIPALVSDWIDSTGQYHISAFDFYYQDEFISGFSQSGSFQPDLFTIDLITQGYWESGFLTFKHDEGNGNSDIFSSDYGYMLPELYNYCRIDSTVQPDAQPQLFQGAWHFSYFDLICIWESWRNGHSQLFSATVPVVIGNVPETSKESDLNARAYPNPFTDFLWLDYMTGETTTVSVTIYNTIGQIVKRIDGGSSSERKTLKKIETGHLPAGIYLLKIEAGHHVGTIRVIKK